MINSPSAENQLRKDLCRLARFGANISDSHSCFIFLPKWILALGDPEHAPVSRTRREFLQIGGVHSLSNDVVVDCEISRDGGLIGWVARHGRSIHVSPFERDSRTLGIYHHDQELKSFIGIPVAIPISTTPKTAQENSAAAKNRRVTTGVIACDSKKSFAFSKLQGKLLEDLSREISSTLRLSIRSVRFAQSNDAWQDFLQKGNLLIESLGGQAVELLRLRFENFFELEQRYGTGTAVGLMQQVTRLIEQALPAHFPLFRLPCGDILILVDNMMRGYYESRIHAICSHLAKHGRKISFECACKSLKNRDLRNTDLEKLISESCSEFSNNTEESSLTERGKQYEYRRA